MAVDFTMYQAALGRRDWGVIAQKPTLLVKRVNQINSYEAVNEPD